MAGPVLHVVVVGFHHKRGCQVEYSYPSLIEGHSVDSHDLPEPWKHLPSLALPDGAHNYMKDTVYFHLPSLDKSDTTIYGVSCYRQIDAQQLVKRGSDVTRNTVQKSVCVLSTLPLYGLIKVKLELITHAYFDERDFSQVSLLEETYKNLNACITDSCLRGAQVFLDLSGRDVVLDFKHKIVLLFKLILLERKVLFITAPVHPICSTLLALLSLFPGMVENGLRESACYSLQKQLSPTMKVMRVNSHDSGEYLEVHYSDRGASQDNSAPKGEIPEDTTGTAAATAAGKSESHRRSASDSRDDSNNKAEAEPGGSDVTRRRSMSDSAALICGVHQRQSTASVASTDSGKLEMNVVVSRGLHCQTRRSTVTGSPGSRTRKVCDVESDLIAPDVEATTSSNDVSSDHTCLLRRRQCSLDESPTHGVDDDLEQQRSKSVAYGAVDVSKITQVQIIQSGELPDETESVLESSPQVDPDTDPMRHLTDITHVESVQNKRQPVSLRLIEEADDSHAFDHDLCANKSLEDLLETEECFNWDEDKLLLEIDDALESRDRSHSTSPTVVDLLSKDGKRAKSLSPRGGTRASGNSPNSHSLGASTDATAAPVNTSSRASSSAATSNFSIKASELRDKLTAAMKAPAKNADVTPESASDDLELRLQDPKPAVRPTSIRTDDFGFPLAVFTKGVLCHPYLCLQYYDLLSDINVRGFCVGATNALFRQKRHLLDVVVDLNDFRIDMHDKELQKQLVLTTADLRFADFLVRSVSQDKGNIFLDDTEWEGGDEWLRGQFRMYLLAMLSTVARGDERLVDDFNPSFVSAWKTTNNYKLWKSGKHSAIRDVHPGHPFHGQLGVADMKLRFAQSMQSTERGKKLNAAVQQTGRVVGDALTTAKSAVSKTVGSWFSGFTRDLASSED